nr:hypothetical protein [Sphingomonas populi]
MALGAGFLVVVAVAIPHLAMLAAPGADVRPVLRVVASTARLPAFVPAPVISAPTAVAADGGLPESDTVYGDAKTADFDPEHPPARMGEPG